MPTHIERQNEASKQRNEDQNRDGGPAGETQVPDVVRSVISSPGRSMDETVRGEIEAKLDADFGDVQIHTGPEATTAADGINARAFTVGNYVAFNKEEYRPASHEGKKLIAHELTHIVQQSEGQGTPSPTSGIQSLGTGVPRIQRVVELRPPGSGEASAFDRRQELIDKLYEISDALEYRLENAGQGAQLGYTVQNPDGLSNFDRQTRGLIAQSAVIPMRLNTSAGQVRTPHGYSPVFVDAAVGGYVDLDDLLSSDGRSFQMNPIHILTERLEIENYEQRIGTPMPEFDAAHRAGLEAEAEYLRSVIGDQTIEYNYEEQKADGTVVYGFESDEGYRVFHVSGEAGQMQRRGYLFVRTADGKPLTNNELTNQREEAQDQAGDVAKTPAVIMSSVKPLEMLPIPPPEVSVYPFYKCFGV